MKTDETTYDTRIALQPETDLEQEILAETFTRLNNLADAPGHPEKVGSTVVFYTLNLQEYDELDHDLWMEADVVVSETGQLSPEPGSRALVVIHAEEDGSGAATEEQIEEAVEAVAEADGKNDFSRDSVEVARRISEAEPLEEAGEETVWELASDAATTGLIDIPIEQPTDDLISDLRDYRELVEDRLEEELDGEDEVVRDPDAVEDGDCGYIKDNDEPCGRDAGWGRDVDEGFCRDHYEMAEEAEE
jgi:hypothetical protein